MATLANNEKEAVGTEELTCKLTTPELRQRKATVIASLKTQMLERKELINGYRYKFDGSDAVLDELTSFIKTEKMCCEFFVFNLSVAGDGSQTWLEITGPRNAKAFIDTELQFCLV